MGKSKTAMTQVDGTSHLKIDKIVESGQLLVTLSRNGKEWLSPVGWVNKEKGTLLDCQSTKDHTIVEIPSEFAQTLKKGDTLHLKSREIDFDASLTWGQAPAPAKPAKKPNGAAPMETLSLEESEKRAKEAEKTAATYRAQMEEAAKAREAAQTAALEAARKADEALKAEADRIAEMEKAAKAFEEAERKRMEEQRRLERERRLEEERKVEEARLAEEARLKAEAERLKKERTEARKFFKTQISDTKAEKSRLQEVMEGFKSRAASAESDLEDNDKRLARLEKAFAAAQREEADNKASMGREETRIGELRSSKNKIQNSISDLEKGNEKLFKSLEKAESAHEKALKEIEAAKIRAAEALKALSAVKAQTDKIKSQKDSLILEREDAAAKLAAHENHLSELKQSYESSRQASEKEQTALKSLKKSKDELSQKLNSAKTDIARTLQDIKSMDDTLQRQQSSLKQIEDMENADEIRKMTGGKPIPKTDNRTEPSKSALAAQAAKSAKPTEEKGGFLSRFFSRSGPDASVPAGATQMKTVKAAKPPTRKAVEPKTDAPARPTKLSTPSAPQINTSSAKPDLKPIPTTKPAPHKENGRGTSGYRLNSWLLAGIAVAGITALGTAYALNSSGNTNKVAAKTPTNSPSADQAEEAEASRVLMAELSPTESAVPVALNTETEAAVSVADEVKAETTVADSADADITEKKEVVADKKETSGVRNAPADKPSAETPVRTVAAPAAQPARDYTVITRQVQEQLSYLGYYNGPVNGLQTRQTQTAIREFKSIYDLPVNNAFSGAFVNRLKRAYDEQVELRSVQINPPQDETVIQVAENKAPVATLEVNPSTLITTTDAAEPISAEEEVLEAAIRTAPQIAPATTPEPSLSSPVQEAALNLPATELVEDVIVPAQVTRKARVEYPPRLLRQEKYYDAKVYVTYDVDTDGRAVSPIVDSVEFEGTDFEREQFERAAIKAINSQRFTPRTVNGETETEKARTTRITFSIAE